MALKIDEVKTVTLRDDSGEAIRPGEKVLFVDGSGRDILATYESFGKGIVTFGRIGNRAKLYGVRAKSIVSISLFKQFPAVDEEVKVSGEVD